MTQTPECMTEGTESMTGPRVRMTEPQTRMTQTQTRMTHPAHPNRKPPDAHAGGHLPIYSFVDKATCRLID